MVIAPLSAQVILFVPPAFKIASPVPTPSRTKLLFITDLMLFVIVFPVIKVFPFEKVFSPVIVCVPANETYKLLL